MHVSELDTPVMLVDLDIVAQNIARLQAELNALGVASRPHIKTHKIPAIGRMQLAAGSAGICCQKVGEAEVFAAAGFHSILIAYNIVGRPKTDRLARLQHQAKAIAAVDSVTTVEGIAASAAAEGVTVPVVVEIDAGGHRAGVQTAAEALALAQHIASCRSLELAGLMCYPTTTAVIPVLHEARERFLKAGLPCSLVSGGGTGAQHLAQPAGLTEHRSGTYVYNDLSCVRSDKATIAQCAMTVLVTVVSTASPGYTTVDGGSKTFTNDGVRPDSSNGYVVEYPDAFLERMNEEHGILNTARSATKPAVGDKVRIIPNHACGTTNLHDYVAAHRGGQVEAIWPIAARGAIR